MGWVVALAIFAVFVGFMTGVVGFAYGMSDNGPDNDKGGKIFITGAVIFVVGTATLIGIGLRALLQWFGVM